MSFKRSTIVSFLMGITTFYAVSHAAVITVSRSGGQYGTIQEAVDAASPGDQIVITDGETYEEQVTIDSTENITLRSDSEEKPTIVWKDTEHIHPVNGIEAGEGIIDYEQNGALRVFHSKKITIEGINVDGNGAFTFGGDNIWGMSAFQHGNAAITLWSAGNVVIRDCDISNAFIGIYIKDNGNGGVNANQNPDDLSIWNFDGFGQDGNHLIENNRIHDNSWGLFLESLWDLGSTVRNNLFYDNHHYSDEFAQEVYDLTDDGLNHSGGAICLKDCRHSPVAVYNNTFRHNFLLFCGHWRAGVQHLIFNNIYSTPHKYYDDETVFISSYHHMDALFPYRMQNCLYASRNETPTIGCRRVQHLMMDPQTDEMVEKDSIVCFYYQVRITNDFTRFIEEEYMVDLVLPLSTGDTIITESVGDAILPGAIIDEIFPNEAQMRWLETDYVDSISNFELFQSVDRSSSDFLLPDSNNPLVQQFIVDKGWESAGPSDGDGSIADIGANPSPGTVARVLPLAPVQLSEEGQAILRFRLSSDEPFENPRISFLRYVNVRADDERSGMCYGETIEETDMTEITTSSSVALGSNELTVDMPETGDYGFFEMVIEGSGEAGRAVASDVGFIPFRRNEYNIRVSILSADETEVLNEIETGDTVKLRIQMSDTAAQSTVSPVAVNLSSGATLKGPDMKNLVIDEVSGSVTVPVVFTNAPEDGIEYINVTTTGFTSSIVNGTSAAVTIKGESMPVKRSGKITGPLLNNRDMNFTVYSMNGRVVYRCKAESFSQFKRMDHMRTLGTGVFLVRMHAPDGNFSGIRRITRF